MLGTVNDVTVWPGVPQPLGATWNERGTNFALFSEVAEEVDPCLFDAAGNETRVALREVDSFIWHGYVLGVDPGQRYGYRVHGPWDPVQGRVCNPHKLLLDPRPYPGGWSSTWDAWTRRHQARARWFHKRTRLACQPEFVQVKL